MPWPTPRKGVNGVLQGSARRRSDQALGAAVTPRAPLFIFEMKLPGSLTYADYGKTVSHGFKAIE